MVKLKFKPTSEKEIASSTKCSKLQKVVKNSDTSNSKENVKQSLNPFKDYIVSDDSLKDNNNDNNDNEDNDNNNNKVSKISDLNDLNDILVNKYHPKDENDLIGLADKLYSINKWYQDYLTKKTNNFLILIGSTGVGKTSLVNIFIKKYSLEALYLNSYGKKNKKDIVEDIKKFINSNNYINFNSQSQYQKSNKIIILDEFQGMGNDNLSVTDIIELKNSNNKNNSKLKKGLIYKAFKDIKLPPLLIISFDSKGSKISDIKKTNEIIWINNIYPSILLPWIKKICKIENIKISEKVLNELIVLCKDDKRLLLNLINYIRFGDKKINIKNLSEIVLSCKKDKDINVYEYTTKLFDNLSPLSCDEILTAYQTDGFIMENLVFENYIDFNNDLDSICKSAESLAISDSISNLEHSSLSGVFSLYGPSVYSRSDIKYIKGPLRSSVLSNKHYLLMCNEKIINNTLLNHTKINFEDMHRIKESLEQIIGTKILSKEQKLFLQSLYDSGLTLNTLEDIHKGFNNSSTRIRNLGIKSKQKLTNITI